MKTILFSVALGALFFAGSLEIVASRAKPVPRVVEAPPPVPAPEPEFVEVLELVEGSQFSRRGPTYALKKKPAAKRIPVVLLEEVEYPVTSRYVPLGRRAVPPPPPARID